MSLIRIAAIDFLNPAPLMWDFEHAPQAERLAQRYAIARMTPAACAACLGAGEAELGLIPIAAYASLPGLAIVPGCTVASLGSIRSILLVLRAPGGWAKAGQAASAQNEPDFLHASMRAALAQVRSVALDTASRTSAMYTRILFQKYWGGEPRFVDHAADLDAMLALSEAALLIGDPALFALEQRVAREARTGERLIYLDLGHAWTEQTGLPWVSAFWAVRQAAASDRDVAERLKADLAASRDAGLANVPALARHWSAQLGLPAATVATYLSRNIHYVLDDACLAALGRFYADAVDCGLLHAPPELNFL